VDTTIGLPSRYTNSVTKTRLNGLARDVFVSPVSPSRIPKLHVQFYVHTETADDKVVEEIIKTNVIRNVILKDVLETPKHKFN